MSFINANSLIKWQQQQHCNLGNKVRVLFTSMSGSTGVRKDLVKQHPNSYIADSTFFDLETQFADTNSAISNTMCSKSHFQIEAQKLGINNDDTLVIYDDYGNFCASRVWFMFKSVGHKNVYVLDGGLLRWLSLSLPVVNKLNINLRASEYTAAESTQFQFVATDYVFERINAPNYHIIDARALQRFTGQIPEARKHLRSGHIPSSSSLHYAQLQNENGELVAYNQLTELFTHYDKENTLIMTCGSGVTACILAHVAYTLGFDKLRVYDGSWSEWGASAHLPIETGIA
ncbi:sulfurtransferase [Glaciecola petra]|uniref:Sulfurtransferase n=1 Tax=Glaciecola petra TaxID=3075602 RepID=A0ABU2ZQD4_9ALTE|nr:sulfurtransferase [Aestuariibacter sp. P117]MDT0594263.1 sulfurtransferase [Aestuariibacter sp. P117]